MLYSKKIVSNFFMKTININQLQAQISRVMKDVEKGEEYQVMRYSRPVAIIRPKEKGTKVDRCLECQGKLDQLLGLATNNLKLKDKS